MATTTVLLAEDEQSLRSLFSKVLKSNGFVVLAACDGAEALRISRAHDGRIDLLISNVQMPGMPGTELARILRASRPDLKVMLVSAYPSGVLLLDNGWYFLQKPFAMPVLLKKIEEVLECEPACEIDREPESGF